MPAHRVVLRVWRPSQWLSSYRTSSRTGDRVYLVRSQVCTGVGDLPCLCLAYYPCCLSEGTSCFPREGVNCWTMRPVNILCSTFGLISVILFEWPLSGVMLRPHRSKTVLRFCKRRRGPILNVFVLNLEYRRSVNWARVGGTNEKNLEIGMDSITSRRDVRIACQRHQDRIRCQ